MARVVTLVALALVCVARGAEAADPRIPAIADSALPVAGTCAPIQGGDVTIVTNGPRTDLKWFGVSGISQAVDHRQLSQVLSRRAGTERPSRHAVWITASGEHAWGHAMRVVQACAVAGIYRVGLRVRSEATGQVMGFPLFLPPAPSARPSAIKAGRLDVEVKMLPEAQAKAPSDVGHVYAAAHRAMQKRGDFGVDRIVADLTLPMNTPLQYAVTALDLLSRAGCAGVRLKGGLRVRRTPYKVIPKIEIQGGIVTRLPQDLKPPPIAPRAAPWPIEGAFEAGWVDFPVTDLPSLGGTEPGGTKPPAGDVPVNYAASARGVPPDVRQRVDLEARRWAHALGADMLDGLRGGQGFARRLAVAFRRPESMEPLVAPARKAFPDATAVIPATLQFNALLFQAGRARGRADLTVHLTGDRLGVIFGTWRAVDDSGAVTLPPLLVDPFARGEPGTFRVWIEGLLADVRQRGAAALPLAPADDVLRYFPAVAHASVRASLAARGPSLDALAAQVARASFDRIVLSVQRGTATVVSGRVVIGVLNFSLRAEENRLRLDSLTARRAP